MILKFFHKRFEFAILQNHSHKHALLFFRKSPHVCDKAFNSWCRFNFHHIQTTTTNLSAKHTPFTENQIASIPQFEATRTTSVQEYGPSLLYSGVIYLEGGETVEDFLAASL
jgi:hypothetical protein